MDLKCFICIEFYNIDFEIKYLILFYRVKKKIEIKKDNKY